MGMTRRLLLLNGVAVLGVIIHHAAHTFPVPMFWWTFLYDPGSAVPNYDQFGSITYYVLIAAMKLTFFAVPGFLFVSGYFVSVISRGQESTLNWKWVRSTIIRLLVPYLVWSLATFIIDWLQSCLNDCAVNSLGQYIVILLTGRAQVPYWYVVLICQFYLLSPFIVALAKAHLRLLLVITIFLQICGIAVIYLGLFVDLPQVAYVIFDGRLFPRDVIYFVFGIVAGLHLPAIKQWLVRFKWILLVALVMSAIFSLLESELIYRITGGGFNYLSHIRGGYTTLPMTLYIIIIILCFLRFETSKLPYSKTLYELGSKSYGIFLLHMIIMQPVPKIFYHLTPWLLEYQILYQPALVTISLGIPLLFMNFVAKSRLRGFYRYLFA